MWKTWWKSGLTAHPALSLAITAGSPFSTELEQAILAEHQVKVHNLYGTSETGAIAYDASSEPRSDTFEMGTLMDGLTLGKDGPALHLQSNATALGSDHWHHPSEFSDTSYHLPDEGYFTGNTLFISQLSEQSINVAGRKVSPEKVRTQILAHPHVTDVQVQAIASHDFERYQEIQATITSGPGFELPSLKAALRNELLPWEIPRKWILND